MSADQDAEPIGGWQCKYCGAYAPEGHQGGHKGNCRAPSGRCGRCKEPIDMHQFVDPLKGCPGKVAA